MNPRHNTSESIKMEEGGSTRRGVKGLVKGLLALKQRHNFHSNLYPLGPTHQDDYTNRRHQAHWTGLDGQLLFLDIRYGHVDIEDDTGGHEAPGRLKKEKKDRTLLYLRISRTKLENASSTLILCLAEVSIKRHPECFARSRPSARVDKRNE